MRKKKINSKFFTNYQDPTLITLIKHGGVGVLPTDTLYGLVASARNEAAVEKVYQLKGRNPDKPNIILIGDVKQLGELGIDLPQVARTNTYWPGPVSVILPCTVPQFTYLHRDTNSLALRLPKHRQLQSLLRTTGPLIAPSANPQDLPPATTIRKAQAYFGDQVDFYLDAGELNGKPSQLISLLSSEPEILRG